MWIFFIVILLCHHNEASNFRHVIYWDAVSSQELLSAKTNRVLNVEIGQFMDILCPQSSLLDMHGQQQPLHFDLFNVTKPYFDKCSYAGRSNFIFSCNRPERENKLTIKFQLISPSPLGFRFKYCQDYYIVAVPRDKDKWGDGCHGNSTTRLHIKVACRKNSRQHARAKFPSATRSTMLRHNGHEDLDTSDDPVIYPKLAHPRSPKKNDSLDPGSKPNLLAQTGNRKNPGNTAALYHPTFSLNIALLFLLFAITTSYS